MSITVRALIVTSVTLAASSLVADEGPAPSTDAGAAAAEPSVWDQLSFGTLWFLHGGYGEVDGDPGSAFRVSRGYLTGKVKPASWFEGRATLDVHQDDTGDLKVRVKYLHAKFKLPVETAVITQPYLEFGVVHGPWLDYEEHVNHYRVQGTMFQERNGLFNSADLGMTAVALLGRELPEETQKRVSKHYPGQWGSVAVGVYNGGGYHALEANDNKVIAGRLSLRPLTWVFPNLQTSYMLYYGRGNTEEQPKWESHAFMVSVEHPCFVLTGTYAFGLGNQKGNKLTPAGSATRYRGFSGFAELKLPVVNSSIIGRYDWFDWGIKNEDASEPATTRIIGGYAVHFLKKNMLLAELDALHADATGATWDWQARLSVQVKFD